MNDKLKQFYKQEYRGQEQLSSLQKARVKQRLLANLPERDIIEIPTTQTFWSRVFVYRFYFIIPLVIIVFTSGTAYASSSSIPGDKLYPVKRAIENTQLNITRNEQRKQKLEINFAKKRIQELEEGKRRGKYKFEDDDSSKNPNNQNNSGSENNFTRIISPEENTQIKDERKRQKEIEKQAERQAKEAEEYLKRVDHNYLDNNSEDDQSKSGEDSTNDLESNKDQSNYEADDEVDDQSIREDEEDYSRDNEYEDDDSSHSGSGSN